MKFYQEHGFNPASSCLPLLLQIPFFISLFYLLRDDKFERDIQGEESFLIISNLAEPAPSEGALVLVVLILLYVATQLAASLVTAVSADRNQRILVLALPIVFVPILINFESGLLVYWITTNIWTFGQQLAVKKFLPAPEPLSLGDGDDKKRSSARTKTAKAPGAAPATADGSGGSKRRSLLAAVGASGGADAGDSKAGGDDASPARRPPPPSPRKKKKRSGRRR